MTDSRPQPSNEHTPTPWAIGRLERQIVREVPDLCDSADCYVLAEARFHGLLPVEEAAANAALIVEAVNSHEALKAQIARMTDALRDSLTENAWNAYYCGVTKEGGKWMDGGRSEGEWLRGELGLGDGWHDCATIQRRIPEIVEKQIAKLNLKAGS